MLKRLLPDVGRGEVGFRLAGAAGNVQQVR